ncbi:MAG TPA: hypothetical protein VFT99_10730, partial [Roseiflexaceae bacterium]|nr:hypothetical protein [Roseiflexaceae bacterium]
DPVAAPLEILQPDPYNPATLLYEAAWMTARFDPRDQQHYVYLYTSGPDAFGDESYTVQVARSSNGPTGPFVTLAHAAGRADSVIYRSNATFVNPGACAITRDAAGQEWMLCHATLRADIPNYEQLRHSRDALWQTLRNTRRVMLLDPIVYHDGWPIVSGGTPSPARQNGPMQQRHAGASVRNFRFE